MPALARITDPALHASNVLGVGVPTVIVGGMPAAVALQDLNACTILHPPNPFPMGSLTVMINNKPALRMGDMSGCGGAILMGAMTVIVN